MGQRFLVCLAAGVVTAGVSGAMIAGAGVAAADTASDSSGASSSESAQSNGSKADSPRRGFGAKQRRAARPDSSSSSGAAASESAEPGEIKGNSGTRRFVKKQRPASRPESAATDPGTSTTEDKTGQADPKEADDHDTTGEVAPADKQARAVDRIATARSDIRARVAAAIGVVDAAGPQTPAAPAKAKLEPAAVARDIVDGETTRCRGDQRRGDRDAHTGAIRCGRSRPRPPHRQLPSVINLVGSAVFNLFGAATRLVEGPPVLPRAARSPSEAPRWRSATETSCRPTGITPTQSNRRRG